MKYLSRTLIIIFSVMFLFALTSCSDVPIIRIEKESGLRINISGGADNARTLFPSSRFTKYVLSFEGPGSQADITLQNETSVLVDLAEGKWTITAKGYVKIDGKEYEAASGIKEVTVSAVSKTVNIPISAKIDGDDGFFSYSITYPENKVNYYADLSLNLISSNYDDYYNFDLIENNSGTIKLRPGYYFLRIRLGNNYQMAGTAEVVHIYSNMETRADYVFTDDDFAETITLSGTVNFDIPAQILESAYIILLSDNDYSMENFNENMVGYGTVNMKNNSWSIVIPPYDNDTTLYLAVYYSAGRVIIEGIRDITIKDQDISNINLGTITASTITLSGAINITYEGEIVPYVVITSNFGSTVIENPDANAPWSITGIVFDTTTPVTFGVRGYEHYEYRNGFYEGEYSILFSKNTGITIDVKDQDISGINLNVGNVLHPSASAVPISVNTWVDGNITTSYSEDWYSFNVTDGTSCFFWLNDSWEGDGTKTLEAEYSIWNEQLENIGHQLYGYNNPKEYYLSPGKYYISVSSMYNNTGTGTYAIKYNVIPKITLSGTINITYEGERVPYVEIISNFGSTIIENPDTNAPWAITGTAFDTNTPVTFAVRCYYYYYNYYNNDIFFSKNTGTTINVKDQNVYGINLNVGNLDPSVITEPISVNTWVNGNISASYDEVQYSFYVTNGTKYYLLWDDMYSGDRTGTLDIDVYIYYYYNKYSRVALFTGNDVDDYCEFTPSYTGWAYIRVRALNGGDETGTYSIKYSDIYTFNDGDKPVEDFHVYGDTLVHEYPTMEISESQNHGTWSGTYNNNGWFNIKTGAIQYNFVNVLNSNGYNISDYDFITIEYEASNVNNYGFKNYNSTVDYYTYSGEIHNGSGSVTFEINRALFGGFAVQKFMGSYFEMGLRILRITFTKGTRYNVSFNLGYSTSDTPPESIHLVDNATVGSLPIPSRTGYHFFGWYLDGVLVERNSKVDGKFNNATLTAHWKKAADSVPEISIDTNAVIFNVYNAYIEPKDEGIGYMYTYTYRAYGNSFAWFSITLDEDIVLGDYDTISFTFQGLDGDAVSKQFSVLADKADFMPTEYVSDVDRIELCITDQSDYIGGYIDTGDNEPVNVVLTIDKSKAVLTGSIGIMIYAHMNSQGNGMYGTNTNTTQYKISNIVFSKN